MKTAVKTVFVGKKGAYNRRFQRMGLERIVVTPGGDGGVSLELPVDLARA
jgi:hypothetical protein